LRGPQIVMGYYNDPEATARVFRAGWFYPGDLGNLGADGLLRVIGRLEDTIQQGDRLMSPTPLEEALRDVPGVRDVAVFGMRASAGGQEICAALVLDTHCDAQTVRAAVAARLGAQAPARLFLMDRLPRNANGKVIRRELIARVQQGGLGS
ncbi:MAG TPA: class I adenylate-forming enzyme family protein, partial [Candidatus Sulfotelmatobacter sp.]|nr:class I adenylate-forming enzyme family protein [Candidatus Sulfotelmatobacter sp.]